MALEAKWPLGLRILVQQGMTCCPLAFCQVGKWHLGLRSTQFSRVRGAIPLYVSLPLSFPSSFPLPFPCQTTSQPFFPLTSFFMILIPVSTFPLGCISGAFQYSPGSFPSRQGTHS